MTAGPCSCFCRARARAQTQMWWPGTSAACWPRALPCATARAARARAGRKISGILLRSRANFAQYEAALERAGVAAAADTGEDLLAQPEVGCVLSLLRVVDNPAQDIHMAAVMLSGMFGFSPDGLARLRLACPQGTLYAAVLQSSGEKEQRLAAALRALRAKAACASLYEVCEEAYARTNWPAVAGAMENGPQRRENLRAFAAYMAAADARGLDLAAFLRGADAALQAGGAAQTAPGAAAGRCPS